MAIEEQHVALPKLYGAPAYARPPRPVKEVVERPFDPDDLPIEMQQTPEERDLAASLPASMFAPGGAQAAASTQPQSSSLSPKPLSLKSLAGRILGGDN
jgi:hypothetical protein